MKKTFFESSKILFQIHSNKAAKYKGYEWWMKMNENNDNN